MSVSLESLNLQSLNLEAVERRAAQRGLLLRLRVNQGFGLQGLRVVVGVGVPDGVLNVIHGTKDAVNFICDHPSIKAISFVGSGHVGKHIYTRGSTNGKRVQ